MTVNIPSQTINRSIEHSRRIVVDDWTPLSVIFFSCVTLLLLGCSYPRSAERFIEIVIGVNVSVFPVIAEKFLILVERNNAVITLNLFFHAGNLWYSKGGNKMFLRSGSGTVFGMVLVIVLLLVLSFFLNQN